MFEYLAPRRGAGNHGQQPGQPGNQGGGGGPHPNQGRAQNEGYKDMVYWSEGKEPNITIVIPTVNRSEIKVKNVFPEMNEQLAFKLSIISNYKISIITSRYPC